MLSALFVGSGRLLIACAGEWVSKGNRIEALISDCDEVSAWSKSAGIARIALAEQANVDLAPGQFDYLFSIVNHTITPPEMLALPARRAINYHDSPLPRFAGFNATTWSIMGGQKQHAVTWHDMSADVDSGAILLQHAFDIQDDDTSFSLGAKCAEAGLASFRHLVDLLTSSTPLTVTPQGPRQDFHLRSDRPDVGLIDFTQSSAKVSAFVRALDLGADDNWMCRAKIMLPAGPSIVGDISLANGQGEPGEILAVERDGIVIATADGAVRCSGLTALDGVFLGAAASGARAGERLADLPETIRAEIASLDARLTKQERFWVRRLSRQHSPALAALKPHAGVPDPALSATRHSAVAPAAGASAVIAAFAAYLARVGEDAVFDLAIAKPVLPEAASFYSVSAPLHLDAGLAEDFATLIERVRTERVTQDKRGTYALDVVTRYGALRSTHRQPLTIGVRVRPLAGLEAATALVAGTHLTLVVSEDGASSAWAYDRVAISEGEVRKLALRVETLLASGLADPLCSVGKIALLPIAERNFLLNDWQGDIDAVRGDTCVHDLFAEQAARTPDAVAATFENRSLTYRELDGRANTVANALRLRGVGPEVLVAVCIERSLDLIVGLLGVLKAGGAYVPLDAAYPRERLGMMLEDSSAPLLLTQKHLAGRLPEHGAEVLCIESISLDSDASAVASGATPDNLAYVIFTSGSTGRPKGVMVQHGNVVNFFTGMDARIGTKPGVWLAVTSISFDISVLELFWTLTRGFEVVIQGESDRASLARRPAVKASKAPMAFGLFYFAAGQGDTKPGETYRLLLEGARFADAHEFSAVWTPERHFHAFGGLYPNPAVTTAAIATITSRIALRAGSVVLPLHNPLRVAEDWSVIDQLSGGRVGLSFASGWHADDFAFMPENYERRREVMLESIDTVRKLWAGEKVSVKNGQGKDISVSVLPRPVQAEPPIWIASAGSVDTFKVAGRLGANVLTNMLGQDIDDLRNKFAAYREARHEAGHEGPGNISVMLHTFVCDDTEKARELARKPFCNYLTSSYDLIKVAPTMFPAFRQPSAQDRGSPAFDPSQFTDEDMAALMDHAFDRYFETAGLFGAPENALAMIERLKSIGANEVACLIDFGIDPQVVLDSLEHLDRLRQIANPGADDFEDASDYTIAAQLRDRHVTHMQCTPSMARILASDPESLAALAGLDRLLLGGEALPVDLVETLLPVVGGEILNMYGPTETTIWSTTAPVRAGEPVTIGRPISNTTIRILDARNQLVPVGVAGELCIGGKGVVRGYLGRPDLTADRFVADPHDATGRLYRTGDLCRYRETGDIEFLGRLDHQVKVNGYRIELGEIETVLGRHPRVHQSVVMARAETAISQLVGYVIPAVNASPQKGDAARTSQWQALWDEAYRGADDVVDRRFNIAGWNSSFSGDPIPADAMREWLDLTEQSILALRPRQVLEIGCGTGMVLYRVLPYAEHYTAVDLSAHALETIRQELSPAERAKVTLLQQPADALDGLPPGSFDTVIINSVCQYFPDAGYFVRVLRRASELLAPVGRIFVGDVRSLNQIEAFHTLTTLHQAPAHLDAAEIARRITKRVNQDGELVLSDAFFHAVGRALPGLSAVDVRLKSGVADTEMNGFRYDVTLHFGAPEAAPVALPPALAVTTLDAVRAALASSPAILYLADLPNARLASAFDVFSALPQTPGATAGDLRQRLAAPAQGINPGLLARLDENYTVDLLPARSGNAGGFDAVLRNRAHGPKGRLAVTPPLHAEAPAAYANRPAVPSTDHTELFEDLRTHLREFLPEYMVPSAFVILDAFPLTPNGKIDRKHLPAPTRDTPRAAAEHVAPSNELEQTIADIWKGLLNLDRVGLRENIFDLGANSLLTAQANQRLSERLGRKVSLVSMFRFPTVETLANHLDQGRDAGKDNSGKVQKQVDRKKDAAARRRELRGEPAGQ